MINKKYLIEQVLPDRLEESWHPDEVRYRFAEIIEDLVKEVYELQHKIEALEENATNNNT